MPSLRELQVQMMDALLGSPAGSPAAALIADSRTRAEGRLAVYANTVEGNFRDALHSIYPAIWRLVGEDYFRQTAREFQHRHPSRSGDLVHCGERFAEFLAQLHADDEFAYLADVARLEWLIQESLLAAEHAPLDLVALAQVPADHYDGLRFELHPALRLYESRYPTLAIWEVNAGTAAGSDTDAELPVIDLRSGGERMALGRRKLRLEFHCLSVGEHAFLKAVANGGCFRAAVEHGCDAEPEFDASGALRRFVAAEALVAFTPNLSM